MKNLIGADIEKWREAINDPLQKIHLLRQGQGTLPGPPRWGMWSEAYPAALEKYPACRYT